MMPTPSATSYPPPFTAGDLDALAQAWQQLPVPVAIVDLESTGGHLENDRITEIAVLRYAEGQWHAFRQLVNPQRPISTFVARLTGISDALVANAPTFAELAPALLPLLRGHLLIAHNSRFDYTFLRHEFARAGLLFAAPTLCTVQLSRKLYPQFFKHNLDSIIERFAIRIHPGDRHRALGDVLALTQFLRCSLQEHGAEHWLAQSCALVKPGFLPHKLPETLRHAAYALSDDCGVSEWAAPGGSRVWHIHEHAFSEICRMLAHRLPESGTALRFYPAGSLLHAHALHGRLLADAPAPQPPAAAPAKWHTIVFRSDAHGFLQAHVLPLGSGIVHERPYGLFAHPKAAKRALSDWALQHGICPAAADILPQSVARHQPCPRAEARLCHGRCRQDAETHNAAILRHAPDLPAAHRSAHEWRIPHTELTAASGCLKISSSAWYFHESLPALLKKFPRSPTGGQQSNR